MSELKVYTGLAYKDPEFRRLVDPLHETGGYPIQSELRMQLFRGASCWLWIDGGQALHIHIAKIGKRKKNKWEPYLNWYTAYTHVDHRRQGHARRVAMLVRDIAIEAGCVRLKSLAGTYAGLRLHMSLGDECWGKTADDEIIIDTPLVSGDWSGIPPNAQAGVLRKMPAGDLYRITKLHYDYAYL